jgi:protein-tyrosine-phosphatase
MAGKNQHVVPHQDRWAVRSAGSDRVNSIHATQALATQTARVAAQRQGTELLIHGRNGQIRERDSYGHDLFPPKG